MSIYRETDDLWRLYRPEWVIVHTVSATGADARECFDQARQWITDNLTGRVRDNDVNLVMNTDLGTEFWCHVQVFKDNLKGEFKHQGAAEYYAEHNNFDEYTIVARNSRADHDIRAYGVKKL